METHFTRAMANERRVEMRLTFKKMVEYANQNDVKVILICGDMFDTLSISRATKNFLFDCISNNSNIDFIVLKGNHDEYDLSEEFNLPNLKFFTNEPSYFEYGNVVIGGINTLKGYNLEVFELMKFDKNKINILCLHGQIENVYNPSTDYCIPLKSLRGKSIDYVALGHIHNYASDKLDERGFYAYSGILEPRGFDECGQKGFIEIETDDKFGGLSFKFVPFSKRRFEIVGVDISNCQNSHDIQNAVFESLKQEAKENIIMVQLVGLVESGLEKDIQYLNKLLLDDFYFAKVVDKTGIKIDFEKLKIDISLKGQFMRLVLADETLSEAQKNAIIDFGIKALTKGEF